MTMAAPSPPTSQPFLWSGDGWAYGESLVGSVAATLYVISQAGAESSEIVLYQTGSPPSAKSTVILDAGFYYVANAAHRHENDSGVVGFIGLNYGTGDVRLYHVSVSGTSLSLSHVSISAVPTIMCVSGDGAEFVLQMPSVGTSCDILGYTVTGSLNWSCSIAASDGAHEGYLAGSPVAGQFVWVNTSSTTNAEYIQGTVLSDEYPTGDPPRTTTTLSFDLSPLTGRSVISSSIMATWDWGGTIGSGPSGGHAFIDGIQAAGDLGANYSGTEGTAYFTGENWRVTASADTGPTSEATVVAEASGFPWLFSDAVEIVQWDNSAANGGHIELRNAEGVIDYMVEVDPFTRGDGQWVTTGTNRLAYVLSSAGGVS